MIIKVCGMRDPDNIRQAAALDIDLMGFIFYPKSPRRVEGLGVSSKGHSPFSILHSPFKRVGVFVNASAEEIMQTAALYGLDYAQLHGDESPETCLCLRRRGLGVLKAFSVATETDVERAAAYDGAADFFLFDTKTVFDAGSDTVYGGSGKTFDWSLLSAYHGDTPFLLSGGIRPASADAIRRFRHPRFAGIDLNSGFETAPGVKDIALLNEFIQTIRKP